MEISLKRTHDRADPHFIWAPCQLDSPSGPANAAHISQARELVDHLRDVRRGDSVELGDGSHRCAARSRGEIHQGPQRIVGLQGKTHGGIQTGIIYIVYTYLACARCFVKRLVCSNVAEQGWTQEPSVGGRNVPGRTSAMREKRQR